MNNLAPKRLLPSLIISFFLLIANINVLYASDIYQCATSKDVYDALDTVKPGDTIMLQGGTVYEIDKSFKLHANGSDKNSITLTSEDSTGQGRYAVISTVDQKKEEDLVAIKLSGSFWNISRIEITGRKCLWTRGIGTRMVFVSVYIYWDRDHTIILLKMCIYITHIILL